MTDAEGKERALQADVRAAEKRVREARAAERAYWANKAQQQAELDEAIAVLKAEIMRPFEVVLGWLTRLFGGRA